jgi:hypothetical protein
MPDLTLTTALTLLDSHFGGVLHHGAHPPGSRCCAMGP